MREHGIDPKVFFAPAHTFDNNTLIALKECSNIRIISDTIANDVYSQFGFTFVPQQSGRVRKLPFKTVTFCYHPNVMNDDEFVRLEKF
jgi:predicted deacetylase